MTMTSVTSNNVAKPVLRTADPQRKKWCKSKTYIFEGVKMNIKFKQLMMRGMEITNQKMHLNAARILLVF